LKKMGSNVECDHFWNGAKIERYKNGGAVVLKLRGE
jgi:hypothetical protein